jgi:DNA-binding ferritin-like protein
MEKSLKIAALFIASLKAIALIHQHNHWINDGAAYFGNHLMFERLYNSAQEDLDSAAEKFVGLFGKECLDYKTQTELLSQILSKYTDLAGDPVAHSLAIEKDFIKFCSAAYEGFEKEESLTLGLDDMIMSISGNREEAVYHLQQTGTSTT